MTPSSRSRSHKAPAAPVLTGACPEWLHLMSLALAGLAFLLLATLGVYAQAPATPETAAPTPTPAVAVSGTPQRSMAEAREEALRLHRERLAQLMQERREERAAEATPAPPTEQPDQMTSVPPPEVAAPAPPPEAAVDAPTFRGSAELLSQPLYVVTQVGERFFTSVMLNNTAGQEVDAFRVNVDYDPQLLRPVRVSDHRLRPLLDGDAELEASARGGEIMYEGELEEPFKGLELEMLTIEWQPLVPIPRTRIHLSTEANGGTSVLRDGRDVLGEPSDPRDGTLGTEVAVHPQRDPHERGALLIDDPQSLRAVQGMRPHGGVELHLVAEGNQVRAGETFAIDVRLVNPLETPIDDLRFALEYDRDIFEVLDAAPSENRRPGDNWIVGGVNLYDAPFQQDFPFDFHVANEANNNTGRADYQMGLSRARPLPDGTIARVFLRALEPARRSAIRFNAEDTSVRCLGIDVLGEIENPSDGLENLALNVAPGEDAAETAAVR